MCNCIVSLYSLASLKFNYLLSRLSSISPFDSLLIFPVSLTSPFYDTRTALTALLLIFAFSMSLLAYLCSAIPSSGIPHRVDLKNWNTILQLNIGHTNPYMYIDIELVSVESYLMSPVTNAIKSVLVIYSVEDL